MTGLALILSLLVPAGALAAAPASQPAAKASEKRELLAEQETVAKFTGIAYQQCRGMTALCPDNCGQSGDFASFEVVSYLTYRKPGQYGDPKTTTYTFQVEDNHKNLKVPKELAAEIQGLKPGDYVLLNWRHDYVTRFEAGGGSASFPERPVMKLQKVSKDEADRLVRQNAAKPADAPASRLAAQSVAFDTHDGYFVSNKFEPDAAASFVVLKGQQAFDAVFGVAFVMGDKSHRLPADAFSTKMVVAAIKRGKAAWTFKVESVTVGAGVLTVYYTATAQPSDSAEFACPLIVSVPKMTCDAVKFVEDGKAVKRIEMGEATTRPR